MPVQVIKEKPKCRRLGLQRAITLKRIGRKPYFSIINVHLVDINVFAKFYEILSLPFQDIEKPKRRGWTNARTNGQRENSIPPQTQFAGGIINVFAADIRS